jgi:hypothetical protein
MKRLLKQITVWVLAPLLICVTLAWAGVTNFNAIRIDSLSEDTYQLSIYNSAGTRVFSVDSSGNVYIAGTTTASAIRTINLPIAAFFTATGTITTISSSSSPSLVLNDALPSFEWSSAQRANAYQVATTFRVPSNYSAGGIFKVLTSQSGTSTPCKVGFDVYINKDATAYDAAVTTQSPVSIAGSNTSNSVVTLTVSTDFNSLTAGDWVTLRIWGYSSGTGDSTDKLRVKGVEFYYTATQ